MKHEVQSETTIKISEAKRTEDNGFSFKVSQIKEVPEKFRLTLKERIIIAIVVTIIVIVLNLILNWTK